MSNGDEDEEMAMASPSNSVVLRFTAEDDAIMEELLLDSPETWRLTNPVHMVVQENAKLPTFNLAVDRTGSAGTSFLVFEPSEPQELSLGESFLGDRKRQSYHANYEQAYALKSDTTQKLGPGPNDSRNDTHSAQDAVKKSSSATFMVDLANVDPIPLSEMKAREEQQRHQPFSPRHTALPVPVGRDMKPTATQDTGNAPTDDKAIADAIATAAKIASHNRSLAAAVPLSITAGRPRPNYALASVAAKQHTRTEQSARRYGFGAKHVVPAVPMSPGSVQRRPKKRLKPTPLSYLPKISKPVSNTTLPAKSSTIASAPVVPEKSMEAYERKKQRAKDARVKLNDAIDNLQIAMDLVAAQSAQRKTQWDTLSRGAAGGKIMQDCIATAKNAKKYDRPSFVGSAAVLIQNLNAQCEALMRELVQQGQEKENPSPRAVTAVSEKSRSVPETIIVPQSLVSPVEFPPVNTDGSVFTNRKVADKIASFLDPLSLVRCTGVSKVWHQFRAFDNPRLWEDLATARFGFYNIRQWRARLEDTDDDEEDAFHTEHSFLTLYKSMDIANAMPHFPTDGMMLLGEARMTGKVSAWTFLVERSNGETLRSVRRKNDSMKGSGTYTSIPVVELRTVVQNTTSCGDMLTLRQQNQTIDCSTRRRSDEMCEIDWDPRFAKHLLNLDGTPILVDETRGSGDLCSLDIFQSVIVVSYICAKGCATSSKFVQRSNYTKILLQIGTGTTVPLVIPFPRDSTGHPLG